MTRSHQRILLLSWHIPPRIFGSAVVVRNLASKFSPDELVIAGERPYSIPTEQLDKTKPEIHYITQGWPLRGRGGNQVRTLQLPLMISRTIDMIRKYECTDVIAVFPCTEFLAAGYFAARLTKTNFFPYFHNTLVENRRSFSLTTARWLQARVFSYARKVFIISDGLAEHYREHYPDVQFSVIKHSMSDQIPPFTALPKTNKKIKLAIMGMIHESCLEATRRVCEAVTRLEDFSLRFISATPRSYLIANNFLPNERIEHITVAQSELFRYLREADILILPHGFTGGFSEIEYRTMFPTKTIDYLISGRPILAHSPPNCFLTRFLMNYGCALVIDTPDTSALIEGLVKLSKDEPLREQFVRNALETSKMFDADLIAEELRSEVWG